MACKRESTRGEGEEGKGKGKREMRNGDGVMNDEGRFSAAGVLALLVLGFRAGRRAVNVCGYV